MTKKFYNQPEVSVSQINTLSIICVSGGGSSFAPLNPGATTDLQL